MRGWLAWISVRRSADARKVFARGHMKASVVPRLPDCGDVWRHLSSGRWRTHREAEDGEGLVRGKVTTNQDFVRVSWAGTSPASATSGRHLDIMVEERLDQQPILGREHCVCGSTRYSGLSSENVWLRVSFSYRLRSWKRDQDVLHAWQKVKAWRVRNERRHRGS